MGRLTGDNLIVLFIQPRGLEALLGNLDKDLVGDWGPIHYQGTAHVEVHEPLDEPLVPRLRLDIVVSGAGPDETFMVNVRLLLAAKISDVADDGKPATLDLALDADPDLAVVHDGSLGAHILALAVRKGVKDKLDDAKLPKAFPIPLGILDPLVSGRPGAWQARLELLRSARGSTGGGIAIALTHGASGARLGFPNPLGADREVALAVNGAHLAARLNALAIEERGRDLALGFRLEHLTFEMDRDALVVGGLVQRRYGRSRWGGTSITIDGRVGLRFHQVTRDARVEVSGLTTRFQAGLAGAAALVAPVFTTLVIGLVSGLIRDHGPKLIGRAIDAPLDSAEAALRGVFADFSEALKGGATMTLHDVAFVDGDLVLTGDVASVPAVVSASA